jgi:hypothetical protein
VLNESDMWKYSEKWFQIEYYIFIQPEEICWLIRIYFILFYFGSTGELNSELHIS